MSWKDGKRLNMGFLDKIVNRLVGPKPTPKVPLSPDLEVTQVADPTVSQERISHSGVFETPKPAERFSFKDSGDDLIERLQPRYLGHGGEHFVYESKKLPDWVIKADKRVLHDIWRRDPEASKKDRVADSLALEIADEQLRHDREVYKKLRLTFGDEHILRQKKFLTKVPVNDEMLSNIEMSFSGSGADLLPFDSRAWTLVTLQERATIPDDSFSPQVGNVEAKRLVKITANKEERQVYSRVTDQLYNGALTEESNLTPEEIKDFFKGSPFEALLAAAEEDPGLMEALKDFSARAALFAEASGEILDFAGPDNIAFFKQAGKWTYKLLDPVYLLQRDMVKTARETAVASLTKNQAPTDIPRSNAFAQCLNFTRTVNAIAKFTGGKTFFDFIPTQAKNNLALNVLFPSSKWE